MTINPWIKLINTWRDCMIKYEKIRLLLEYSMAKINLVDVLFYSIERWRKMSSIDYRWRRISVWLKINWKIIFLSIKSVPLLLLEQSNFEIKTKRKLLWDWIHIFQSFCVLNEIWLQQSNSKYPSLIGVQTEIIMMLKDLLSARFCLALGLHSMGKYSLKGYYGVAKSGWKYLIISFFLLSVDIRTSFNSIRFQKTRTECYHSC